MMASLLQMNTASTSRSGTLPGNTVAHPKGELKAITTRSGLVTNGPTIPNPSKSVNPEEDECVEETYTDPDHAEHTIKVPPPPSVQKPKPPIQRNVVLHTRDSLPPHIPYPSRMLKQKQQEKDDIQIQKFWNIELKCKALADLAASINLMPLYVWKKLRLPDLIPTRMTLELANRAICTPDGIARDVFVPVGEDSDFKDSIDQFVLANLNDLFVDPTPEMFTDEQPPDYSFPPRFDVYPDDFLEIESDAFDDNSFDSEGEKIKEAELLIDPLDLPCDILFEYDSFNSQDFSRDDVLPSPDNENKVFNSGILSHAKSIKIIIRVNQEKKLAVSFASLLFEDFDPTFYELLVFKEVPNSMRLLPFSSENEETIFKPGIYISKKFHCCFLPELSHQ
nr:reverse transcriptase domain-containing protein [Tanacetum cinerariifolium]